MENFKVYVWDTGTTGKTPDRDAIRALAVVEYSSSTKFVTRFSSSVRLRDVSVLKTYDATAPPFSLAWEQFRFFISSFSGDKQPLLISHNAAFDLSFLLAELARDGLELPSDWHFGCSLQLSRSVNVDSLSHSQSALANRFDVFVNREHHAEADVLVLRNILMAIDERYCRDGSTGNSTFPLNCHGFHGHDNSGWVGDADRETNFSLSFGQRKVLGDEETVCPCVEQILSAENDKQSSWATTASKNPYATPIKTIPSAVGASLESMPSLCEGKYFITNSGSKFHVDGCKWLRRSRIAIDLPPAGLGPCGTCLPDGPSRSSHNSTKQESYDAGSPSPDRAANVMDISKTGSKYHTDGCKWTRRSKIPKSCPPSGYSPCGTGRPDKGRSEHEREQKAERDSCASPISVTEVGAASFYLTKSGEKYHVEGRRSLKKSKIPTEEPPIGYAPSQICIGGGGSTDVPASKNTTLSHAVKRDGSEANGITFYVTKTGKKLHIDGCRALRSSKITCDSPPTGYAPCGICLPFGLKQSGSASSCFETVESMELKLATFRSGKVNVKKWDLE